MFCQKTQNFVLFGPISISSSNIKYPIGNSVFAVNLPLKLFHATIANADIGSLKSLHTFLTKCLYHMLVKCEQNRMVQITRNFELFDNNNKKKKRIKKKRFRQSVDAILEDIL